ncbi:unnamed protein product [Brachionus calyciflorus]|uniref:Uncharacterized protein n=1 Tax=Brachionus calyciflorus TaxID=104777 RepID=A0A814FJZ9_9BILA|nr:unnamed protein product [Brachionus calyciflorus]
MKYDINNELLNHCESIILSPQHMSCTNFFNYKIPTMHHSTQNVNFNSNEQNSRIHSTANIIPETPVEINHQQFSQDSSNDSNNQDDISVTLNITKNRNY